jgi:mono/diheme cytochrome c family protein
MSKKKRNNQTAPGSAGSIAGVHGGSAGTFALTADRSEPVAQDRPVPVALIIFTLIFLYYADLYIMGHGGDGGNNPKNGGAFPAVVYDPYRSYAEVETHNPIDPVEVFRREGQKIYKSVAQCSACHQDTGLGAPGQFPPLAGSEWVLDQGPNRIIRVVLNGFTGPVTVKGQSFNATMVPFRDILNDTQIAQVLTYVRSEWGNKAPPVTPDQVKKVRDQIGSKSDSWTEPELLSVPAKE